MPDKSIHPLAFPTAIGFGRHTSVRASNAVVYKINSLEDSANAGDGKITYRECALALPVTSPYNIPGGRPRYCVFDVSGAITLQSQAAITNPKIYIAGQTSPGGIEFRLGNNYNPVSSLIDTRRGGDHMILRHVRARFSEHANRTSSNGDPIRLNSTSHQIIDHVSSMYGTDESLNPSCTDCTIQWSIIGPNLCNRSGHVSGFHCKVFFINPGNNITIAHNISQHGIFRGINIGLGIVPSVTGTTGQTDIFNNIIYHFTDETGILSNERGSAYANYMGNVAFRGPNDKPQDNYLLAIFARATTFPYGFKVYLDNNVTQRTRVAGEFGQSVSDPQINNVGFPTAADLSNTCGVNSSGSRNCSITGRDAFRYTSYVTAPGVNGRQFEPWHLTGPEQAMRDALAFAGADLCRDGNCRDNVDSQFIEDLRTCDRPPYKFDQGFPETGAQAFGYASFSQRTAQRDSDNDGMPDDWENQFRNTNANRFDANADADGDGYPNIEEYLNFLAQDHRRYRGFIGSGQGALPDYNCGRPMF
ncbi:hypothetical protein [Aurantiacibacter poecillastricola]|uniref:hypothetical protein n=1 Tax=Aurantiacibacter poecillastricola TaxID=3064385 RepID=UPI0027401D95|nr:hypothetical protein [Aurantiacibacter sp. 219JJ12-13]MDP5260005.1 hypothetical protein [Aurantiacibacter sp. 219JJ12-13]